MMIDDEFRHKYALLDTNILLQLVRVELGRGTDNYRPIFEFLKENKADIFLIDALYFELTSFITSKKDRDRIITWTRPFPVLPMRREDTELAALLASYYANTNSELNKKQISYIDCLCAAQIIKSKGKSFIVTTDLYDYPISLFDIKKLQVIDDGKKAVLVGFITYNELKFKRIEDRFLRSR